MPTGKPISKDLRNLIADFHIRQGKPPQLIFEELFRSDPTQILYFCNVELLLQQLKKKIFYRKKNCISSWEMYLRLQNILGPIPRRLLAAKQYYRI